MYFYSGKCSLGCGVRAPSGERSRDLKAGRRDSATPPRRGVSLSGDFAVTHLPGQKSTSSRGVHEDSGKTAVRRVARRLRGERLLKVPSCRTRRGVVVTPASGKRSACGSKCAPTASCASPRWPTGISSCPRASWWWPRAEPPPAFKVERKGDDLDVETATAHRARVARQRRGDVHRHGAARRCWPKTPARRARRAASRSASIRAPTKRSIGLGQHQNAQMNLNGEDVELAQHNMDIAVPFVVSSRNYGVLWDNNSHHALRQSEALRARVARPQDPRRRGQGGRLHRELLHRRRS